MVPHGFKYTFLMSSYRLGRFVRVKPDIEDVDHGVR